jgi:hypothetical protein
LRIGISSGRIDLEAAQSCGNADDGDDPVRIFDGRIERDHPAARGAVAPPPDAERIENRDDVGPGGSSTSSVVESRSRGYRSERRGSRLR